MDVHRAFDHIPSCHLLCPQGAEPQLVVAVKRTRLCLYAPSMGVQGICCERLLKQHGVRDVCGWSHFAPRPAISVSAFLHSKSTRVVCPCASVAESCVFSGVAQGCLRCTCGFASFGEMFGDELGGGEFIARGCFWAWRLQ